jgi:hypothetical protein
MIASAARILAGSCSLALALSACATPQSAPVVEVSPEVAAPIAPAQPRDGTAPPVIGANEALIRAEYGAPDFVREETESQLWRYDGGECALFVFLYLEAGTYVMRHAETDPPGADGGPDAACLTAIRSAAEAAS